MGKDLPGSVDSYMDDSDPGNIARLGHRRWCLLPELRRTGFGSAGKWSAMWTADHSAPAVKGLKTVKYPPAGFIPADFFDGGHAWSIAFVTGPWSARVDARVSGGDSFFSRYNVQDSLVTGPQYVVFAAALSGQQQYVPIRTQSFIASYVRVLRSNLMNETKFGINRFAGRLGELDPGSPEPIPQTTITGVNVVPGLRAETSQHSTSFEYIDNLSWFRGAHAVKAGVNTDVEVLMKDPQPQEPMGSGATAATVPPGQKGLPQPDGQKQPEAPLPSYEQLVPQGDDGSSLD